MMNLLSKAITAQRFLLSTHHQSRKCIFKPQPIAAFQQFSLYATTKHQDKTRIKTQQPRKSRTQKSLESSPSSLNWSDRVKKQAEVVTTWPKPSEIPYQAKVANSVNLIGFIQIPVQFHATPDGKHLAATFIVQENGVSSISKSSDSSYSLMIPVVFEGDLAHIVACHVKQNDCVYVTGKLCVDPLPFVLSEDQGKFHILGQEINFVQGFERRGLGRVRKDVRKAVDTVGNLLSVETDDADEDAELKRGSEPVAEDAISKLPSVETKSTEKGDDEGKFPSLERDDDAVNKIWEDLVAKPDEWWIIRSTNDGLKGELAGFKHKDTGELVQIDEFTPLWVYKKLECVKFDDEIDQRCSVTLGMTKDGDVGKIDQKSLNKVGTTKDGDSVFNSWRDLVRNPKDWWDNRERKSNGLLKPNYPDFKHKTSGDSLWLNKAPSWVLQGLQGLDFEVQVHKGQLAKGGKEDDNWKSLVENPGKWWDNRLGKKNERAPDFKHKETGEGLWLNSSPAWVLSRLPPPKDKQIVSF